jgi:parallel beta-helix repeat protein
VTHRIRSVLSATTGGLALCLALPAPAGAATWFVNNQSEFCANGGPGSELQPYCTITAAANDHHAPGDTILVLPGTYREKITISASGAPGAPFVYLARGPGVVIDGSDDFADPALWSHEGGGVWLAASVTWEPFQIVADGARVTPSTAPPNSLPANAFTWVDGVGLFVNLGGDNPGAHATMVGHRSYGFHAIAESWVNIIGFEITRTESRSIFVEQDCTDMVIAGNRVSFSNRYGIQADDAQRLTIEHNVSSDNNYHGIGLTDASRGCIVRDNESYRNIDPAVRRANGIYVRGSYENTISGNRLHDNQDSGMFFTSGSDYNLSFNNRSWNNGDHGFDHVDSPNNIHSNDVAFGNYKDGFSIEGDSHECELHNCIAVDNGLTTDEFDLWVNGPSAQGFVSDYNLFWNSTSQVPFKFIVTPYGQLGAYQAASGQDAHTLQADPRFKDAPHGDFSLVADSPAIDAGTSARPEWPAVDAIGDARVDQVAIPDRGDGPVTYADIGALEVQQQVEPDAILLPNPLGTIGDPRGRHAVPFGAGADSLVALSSGYPNPSRGTVEFTLVLPAEAEVRWEVFDLQGRSLRSETRRFAAGRSVITWDGRTEDGTPTAAGVYLVHARVGGQELTRRVARF